MFAPYCSLLRKNHQDLFKILTKTKVKFRFVDKTIILENWGELIELNENNKVKQVRYSTRLDYVPALSKKETISLFILLITTLNKSIASNL